MFNWIAEQIEWVKSFLSEESGKGSSKRIMGVGVVIVFLIAYLRIALATQVIEDIPTNWALFIGSVIGLGTIDKIATGYVAKTTGKTNGTAPPKAEGT